MKADYNYIDELVREKLINHKIDPQINFKDTRMHGVGKPAKIKLSGLLRNLYFRYLSIGILVIAISISFYYSFSSSEESKTESIRSHERVESDKSNAHFSIKNTGEEIRKSEILPQKDAGNKDVIIKKQIIVRDTLFLRDTVVIDK
jgi:hypothetical protein